VIVRTVYDPDHEALRGSVRRFFEAEAVPHYADWDAKGAIPAAFWAAAAGYGFVGLAEAGDPRFAAVVLEEAMAAGLPAVALALAIHESVAPLTGRDVPGLVAVVAAGVTPNGTVLSGAAETVLNGLGAALLLVAARTDDDSVQLFTVAGDAAGLHRAPADALLGLDALDVADLRFDAVAAEPVVGDLTASRSAHQVALAVAAMAGARTALSITVDYVQQRKAFGRPIAEFENTRHVLSRAGARVSATTAFVDTCLAAPTVTPETAAAALVCAADTLDLAVDTGVQLHGGYGYMWEYPIARAYAAARFFRAYAGRPELDGVLANAIGL
jgi:alkylation response protein AidB-like acyl-CoA dehydrogenase